MILDPNLQWAFVAIGASFMMWGFDHVMELAIKRSGRFTCLLNPLRYLVYVFYFFSGAYIILKAFGIL